MSANNIIDVLVVGAGPVGLFLATELARHGVKSFKVIEKLPSISILSKAVALHARSLEIIPNLAQFIKQGITCHHANFYARSKKLGGVVFDRIKSEYPFALLLPQDETEQILNDQLEHVYGCHVDRGMELLDLTEFMHPTGDNSDREEPLVRATIRNTKDNSEQVVLARYVIGCDGARSLVRKAMKVQMIGITTKDVWMTADVHIKEEDFPKGNEITGVLDEKGFVAFFPLKEKERRFRLAINVINPPEDMQVGQELSLEELQKVVDERSDSLGHKITFYNPRWITTFKINERRVESMKKSRLMVCGDAAHVHSPAGGQGMNTGIQDAHNLAWKLALVLKGAAKEEILLNSFATEREHIAKKLLKNTGFMRSVVGTNSAILKAVRNTLMPMIIEFDSVKDRLASNMGQMDIAYPQSTLTSHYNEPLGFFKLFKSSYPSQFLGARLPHFNVTKVSDSCSSSSHTIVRNTTKHILFVLNDEDDNKSVDRIQNKLKEAKLDELVQIEVIANGGSHVSGVQVWRDDTKEFHKAFHLEEHSKGLAVLVRPDGYIGFISGLATADIDAVVSHLKSYLSKSDA